MGTVRLRVLIAAFFAAAAGACKSDSPLDPVERAAHIEAASSVELSGVVGTVAASAPTVRVTDKDGDPVANAPVIFSVTVGAGSVNPSLVTTDADGRATAAWTLGTAVATQTLKASVSTLEPVVFTARAVAGPPTGLERSSGDNQIVATGSVAGSQLKARVIDSYRNPVQGVTVSFSVLSGGGTVTPAAVSDSAGIASATWTVGPLEGVQRVEAQGAGGFVTFTADTFSCASQTSPCVGLGQLIFVRTTDYQIYRINADGTGLAQLTTGGAHGPPVWSPDGNRIAFAAGDLYIMNADGSNLKRRTTGPFYSVAWSPDGQTLALDGPSGGDSLNISTVSADGEDVPRILKTNAAAPSWSPDGRKIAYARGTAYYDPSQIYIMNADGSDPHRATPDSTGYNGGPAWSPDGSKIAFTRCTAGCGIYALELATSALTLVSPASGSVDAKWSPDGRWLALTIYGSNAPSVNYLPASGGNPRFVASNAFGPAWRPRPH
jgi:Tol biopolymer transport system component